MLIPTKEGESMVLGVHHRNLITQDGRPWNPISRGTWIPSFRDSTYLENFFP